MTPRNFAKYARSDRGALDGSPGRNAVWPVIALLTVIALAFGCGRSPPPTAPATPSAAPAAAPALPVPTFSAAQKIGMFVFPKNSQGRDQQLRDELDCYNQVQQQTGVDLDAPPPQAPSASEIQAAQDQAAGQAPEAQGGRARGAARGALGGAAVGAIAGDTGKGAAIGAVVGTMQGGSRQRQANEQSKQQAAQSASAQLQQQYQQSRAAYNQQRDTFKRGFTACMDARGYSVN